MHIYRVGHGTGASKQTWLVAIPKRFKYGVEGDLETIKQTVLDEIGEKAITTFDHVEYLGKACARSDSLSGNSTLITGDKILFVLVEEPYHENSTVIGVFDNEKDALEAFLRAPYRDPVGYHEPETWDLQSWNCNGKGPRKTVVIHSKSVISVESLVPMEYRKDEHGGMRPHKVDLKTFTW